MDGESTPDSASELPLELTAEVLSRLPVKTLFRFKSVCKSWRRLIESPSFIPRHLNHSVIRGDAGDPNGARSLLVKRRCRDTDVPSAVTHGFGYHRAVDDYKVVRIAFQYSRGRPCFRAKVFALSEGSWREVPALPCKVYSLDCVALNGIVYWVAYNCGSDDMELILSFDMREEVFRRVYLPDLGFKPDGSCMKLAVCEQSLCLMTYNFRGRAKCLDLWVIDGGVGEESWTKRLSIGPIIGVRMPLGCGANGEIFVEKSNGGLAIYEASSETVRDLPVRGSAHSLDAHFYIESLVSITR
ncbi:F-box/kelch-repeat protein At3g23880-like isoform X2 [Punica granatum]|uniref:F-box/kelch-repeat protein At3g23880-like isoform X2 n=1 Tax=Punica granatum TaxID=22663 RepID=A0A6P8DAE1_PUNGR|nr:F-box/kelch-repeat protein At3g23880-like isoform X2 [Punica granatum]